VVVMTVGKRQKRFILGQMRPEDVYDDAAADDDDDE